MLKMDKYEFNIKVEQLKKMVSKDDYETAMKIADTIDWRRVRNVNILSMVATIYEKNEEFQEAKDILLLAFERAPISKRLLYKLSELAIREGSINEAEDYYREFCDLASDDPRQYILRYLILGAKGAPVEQLIHTLEQYCNAELDEKWLYELACLYKEAGAQDLCVMTCDKLMLMFGLGNYVDKAMELKLQYAPLNKYQMDLVENKDKYEAKLKAVEQEFHTGATALLSARYEEPAAAEEEESVPERRFHKEAAYSREEEYLGETPEVQQEQPVYEEPYSRQEQPVYEEPYSQEAAQQPYEEDNQDTGTEQPVFDEADGENYGEYQEPEDQEAEGCEDYQDDQEPEDGEAYQDNQEYEEPLKTPITIEPESAEVSDATLRARIHEEEVQKKLAREMSRISATEETEYTEEPDMAQTRVLTDIRELNKVPVYSGSNHLMIEANVPEEGLNLAVQALKKIHQETGATNQAAKITGSKLNRRGIFTLSDKLTGKDLIIEQAGDMNEAILQELNQLMARDETGMNVVLIDTPKRLEELHRVYPGLAKRFECIGAMPVRAKMPEPDAPVRPVRQVQVHPQAAPLTMAQSEHAAPAAKAAVSTAKAAAPVAKAAVSTAKAAASVSGTAPRAAEPVAKAGVRTAGAAAPAARTAAKTAGVAKTAEPAARTAAKTAGAAKTAEPAASAAAPAAPASNKAAIPARPARPVPSKTHVSAQTPRLQEPEEDTQEMDIDEFAKYAGEYASQIDCSISGKSMLALYERIEMMEEDGIPLIKANAEDLIEEAADRAENPKLLKRMTGIFSSKYDKEGLLILKEEHFI